MKKIIGLSCGRKNGNCETFLRAAAMGAEEFGVKMEIIRALSLKVLPCTGCFACTKTYKCILKDDVEWILEKTCVEDCGLIAAVPCYHIRANAYFTCISDRINHVFLKDMSILKKTRVGGIIGIGGGGYDAWASLTLSMVNIFIQQTRVLVDQIQVNHCGLREWNTWLSKDKTQPNHIHEVRGQDLDYEKIWEMWPQDYTPLDFKTKALKRAMQLGRNVAKAMNMPIEEVKYVGEETSVSCPVCHCNLLLVPEALPHVYCPVCAVRGVVSFDNGKMAVEWNEEDAKHPRFSHDAVKHHEEEWLRKHRERTSKDQEKIDELTKGLSSYGKIIKPEK